MKRIITSVFGILFTIATIQAQTTTKGHKGHKQEQKMAYEKLNLSADQKARMKAIREDFKKQAEELKKQDNLTVAEMKKRRKALHKEHKAQVERVLTPEQKVQMANMILEDKQRKIGNKAFKENRDTLTRGGKTMQGRGSKKSGELSKELELSTEQRAKIKEIRKEYKSKIESVRNDNALSPDQKKTKLKELTNQQNDQVKMILTKEQIEKMELLRKERPAKNIK